MELPHIIILALAIGALLAGGIWLLVTNLRRVWPEGKRFSGVYESGADYWSALPYLVHVIFAPGVQVNARARSDAMKAVWAAGAAWNLARKDGRVTKDDFELHEVVVLFASAKTIRKQAVAWGYKNGLSGYIDRHKTKKWGGDLLPMAVISELSLERLHKDGEPVIHEMLHALERDYVGGADDHSNPVVWLAAAVKEQVKPKAVQLRAREIFALQQGIAEA